jgi:hypothetical protein
MRSYYAARLLFSFLGLMAWSVIVIGVIAAFGGVAIAGAYLGNVLRSGNPNLILVVGAVPGAIVAFFGFLGLAIVQMGRSSVDTAELTQQMLKVSRDQLAVSKQSMNRGEKPMPSFAKSTALRGERSFPSLGDRPSLKVDPVSSVGAHESKLTESNSNPGEPQIDGNVMTYKGRTAELAKGEWRMNGIVFGSQEKLIAHIDQLALREVSAQTLRAER